MSSILTVKNTFESSLPASQEKPVFHFVVPGLLEAVSATSTLSPKGTFPTLEKLIARSEKTVFSHDYPHILANLFQMQLAQNSDVPVGALSAIDLVSHDQLTDHCWLKATPVLLKPDRDRLVLDLSLIHI